jgi:hypothetical protein
MRAIDDGQDAACCMQNKHGELDEADLGIELINPMRWQQQREE